MAGKKKKLVWRLGGGWVLNGGFGDGVGLFFSSSSLFTHFMGGFYCRHFRLFCPLDNGLPVVSSTNCSRGIILKAPQLEHSRVRPVMMSSLPAVATSLALDGGGFGDVRERAYGE